MFRGVRPRCVDTVVLESVPHVLGKRSPHYCGSADVHCSEPECYFVRDSQTLPREKHERFADAVKCFFEIIRRPVEVVTEFCRVL